MLMCADYLLPDLQLDATKPNERLQEGGMCVWIFFLFKNTFKYNRFRECAVAVIRGLMQWNAVLESGSHAVEAFEVRIYWVACVVCAPPPVQVHEDWY